MYFILVRFICKQIEIFASPGVCNVRHKFFMNGIKHYSIKVKNIPVIFGNNRERKQTKDIIENLYIEANKNSC